jgi:hypothetical protein
LIIERDGFEMPAWSSAHHGSTLEPIACSGEDLHVHLEDASSHFLTTLVSKS